MSWIYLVFLTLYKEKAIAEHKAQVEKEKQDKILAEQKAKAKAEKEEQEERLFAQKIQADARQKLIEEKTKQARKIQQAKLEAERKEREKIQARLDKQVRCPFCKKWFVPERRR